MLLKIKKIFWIILERIKVLLMIPLFYFRYLKFKKENKKIIIFSACNGFGDYLWSRHIAYSIRNSEKYKNFKIIAITVQRWTDFVLKCDSQLYDLIIPIEVPAFAPKILLKFLRFLKCDLLIQMEPWIKSQYFSADTFYNYQSFSVHRSQFGGTQYLIQTTKTLGIQPLYAPLPLLEIEGGGVFTQPFVILTFSAYSQGSFSKTQLLKIIEIIYKKTDYKILFFGDAKDIYLLNEINLEIAQEIKMRFINGINRFPTYQLAWIINKSQFVICPNTAIYHFCLFLKKPCVCVSAHSYNTMDFSQTKNEYVLYDDNLDSWENRISQIETEKIEKSILKMLQKHSTVFSLKNPR